VVDEAIVRAVQDYLRNVSREGVPVAYGIVYGSQARGETHQWSDIDLLVVSTSYDARREWEDASLLWHIAARTDSRIEPIPVGLRQFAEDDSSAIIEMARREGQIIPLVE
jgi:predicted nucleotidyltransferase